jgi:hypothetical protein
VSEVFAKLMRYVMIPGNLRGGGLIYTREHVMCNMHVIFGAAVTLRGSILDA